MDAVFIADPAVNPPCTVMAGSSFGTTAEPEVSPQASTSTTPTVRRKCKWSDDQPSVWAADIFTDLKEQNKNVTKQLEKLQRKKKEGMTCLRNFWKAAKELR